MPTYTEELVYTFTLDGILTHGLIYRPATPRPGWAIVLLHGLYGSFYSPSILLLSRALAERGWLVVTGNTRGHDLATALRKRDGTIRRGGAIWEVFDESALDVQAWIDFSEKLGAKRIALGGHSQGAAKVAYYAASRQDKRLGGLVLASIPGGPSLETHDDYLAAAERLIAAGQPEALIETPDQTGGFRSAQTLHNRYRPGQNFDPFGLTPGQENEPAQAAAITLPILAFYGTKEAMIGGARELELIQAHSSSSPGVTTQLFEGLDHSYIPFSDRPAGLISDWLETL